MRHHSHDGLGLDVPGHDAPYHDAPGHDVAGHDAPGHDAPSNSLEDFLVLIGPFGRYQRWHYAVAAGAWVPAAFCTLCELATRDSNGCACPRRRTLVFTHNVRMTCHTLCLVWQHRSL